MDDKKIYYSPINTTINFIVVIGYVVLFVVLYIQTDRKVNAIIFIIIGLAIAGQIMYNFIKSFFFLMKKRPAIVLTQECFTDNSMGIEINWTDINDISIYNFNGCVFLAFDVIDNSIIYRQMLNPIQNVFLRINTSLSKKSFMTNFSFMKGKNSDIFEIVNSYYQNVLKN